MDTLIRIYLYFIGVIAVLICFITWVSIRLRAERINRIRIEKERDEKYIEFTESANAGIETIKLLKKDIEFIEKARDQAVDYANTLFKDLKGALEMNAKLMGATKGLEQPEWIHTDKIKVDFVELEPPKPSRDWSVPQAFPDDYIIPVGTEIIAISDSSSHPLNATGIKGVINHSNDCIPSCIFGKEQKWMKACELAPINPLDHPEHPQFNKK